MIATIQLGQLVQVHVDCTSQEKPFITNVKVEHIDITDLLLELGVDMDLIMKKVRMSITKTEQQSSQNA